MKSRLTLLLFMLCGSLMLLGAIGFEIGELMLEKPRPLIQWAALAGGLAGAFVAFAYAAALLAFPRMPNAPAVVESDAESSAAYSARARHRRPGMFVNLVLAIAGIALVGCSSCSALSKEGRAVAGDVVDCVTTHAEQLDHEFGPVMDTLLRLATGDDGAIDWPTIRTATLMAEADGRCVLARAVARLAKPPSLDQAAPKAAGLEVDRELLLSGFRQTVNGVTYRTPDGDI